MLAERLAFFSQVQFQDERSDLFFMNISWLFVDLCTYCRIQILQGLTDIFHLRISLAEVRLPHLFRSLQPDAVACQAW